MIEGMETRISSISKDIAEFLMNVMGYKDVASVSFVQRFRSGSWKLCDRTIRNVFIYISNNISCPLDEFKSNLDFFDSILELNEELILEDNFLTLIQYTNQFRTGVNLAEMLFC